MTRLTFFPGVLCHVAPAILTAIAAEGADSPDAPLPAITLTGRIAASFTTAHRPAFFKRTYHSFRARCQDCDDLIDSWIAVDDFSSAADLAAMQKAAPPGAVRWVTKPSEAKGHVASINAILNEVGDAEYLLYMEDDWYFFKDEHFVTRALAVLEADPSIGQVLFNTNYRELDDEVERTRLAPPQPAVTPSGQAYGVHKYAGKHNSEGWIEAHAGLAGKSSHYHWPHFSLRPGLWRLSAIRDVGAFEDANEFEYEYAFRYIAKGYKTAFLPGMYAMHLAPLPRTRSGKEQLLETMYAKHGMRDMTATTTTSAYTLANTIR
jgi:GT2 family glycosyltransferase